MLRAEVGFGCPVAGCGNPYLEWHHFDPPWHMQEHHNSAGMIALCGEHHKHADAGAFTTAQLRELKRDGEGRNEARQGRFNWLRNNLLAVVGGNFFYETPNILTLRDEPAIWLSRDESGYLMVNLRMLTTSGEPRLRLEENFWTLKGKPTDFECPPSGRLIQATYPNGDEVRIEFFPLGDFDAARKRYPSAAFEEWQVEFPITAVEVTMEVGGTDISFGPKHTTFGPGTMIKNSFWSRCHGALALS